jgi:FtsZ-binding cell division protein ZapB
MRKDLLSKYTIPHQDALKLLEVRQSEIEELHEREQQTLQENADLMDRNHYLEDEVERLRGLVTRKGDQ